MSYAPGMRQSKHNHEPASAQIGIRWKPSERAVIEEAAKASGEALSTIIVNGALREAARLIRAAKPETHEPQQGS